MNSPDHSCPKGKEPNTSPKHQGGAKSANATSPCIGVFLVLHLGLLRRTVRFDIVGHAALTSLAEKLFGGGLDIVFRTRLASTLSSIKRQNTKRKSLWPRRHKLVGCPSVQSIINN